DCCASGVFGMASAVHKMTKTIMDWFSLNTFGSSIGLFLLGGESRQTHIDVICAGWFGRLLVADVRPGNLSQDLEIKLDTKLNISRGAGSTNRAKPGIS